MAITYTWTVDRLDCRPEDGIVTSAGMRINGGDGINAASVSTSIDIPLGKPPYQPLTDLSEEGVVAWVKKAIGTKGVASIEMEVAQKIGNLTVRESPRLPWLPPEETEAEELI